MVLDPEKNEAIGEGHVAENISFPKSHSKQPSQWSWIQTDGAFRAPKWIDHKLTNSSAVVFGSSEILSIWSSAVLLLRYPSIKSIQLGRALDGI